MPVSRSVEPFVSAAPPLGFVGAFDGWRGIGVTMVLVAHLFPGHTESFQPIVDSFFVLSAFLIMSLLFQEHREHGRLDLRRFFARRALRLLPNSYACMAAWLALWVLGTLVLDRGSLDASALRQFDAIPGNVAAAGLYVYHLVYPPAGSVGPLNQFWSLSVEEQFYGVVALAVVWMLRSRRRVQWACVALAAAYAYVGWQRYRFDLGPWPGKLYETDLWTRGLRTLWTVRPDAFFVGAVLAVVNAGIPDPLSPRLRRLLVASGSVAAVLLVVMVTSSLRLPGVPSLPGLPHAVRNGASELQCQAEAGGAFRPCTDSMWLVRWLYTAFSLTLVPPVLCVARVKDCRLARVLAWAPLRKLGERSYSLYLWHLLAYFLAEAVLGGLLDGAGISRYGTAGRVAGVVGRFGAALVLGFAAHRWIDRRMIAHKVRFSVARSEEDRSIGRAASGEYRGGGSGRSGDVG